MGVICFNEFFEKEGQGIDRVSVVEFFDKYFDKFVEYIRNKDSFNEEMLVPESVEFIATEFKKSLIDELSSLHKKVQEFPEQFMEDDRSEKTTLDTLLESGIFPTYSFPKDVVGFYVEDRKGDKIEQKPDRSIEQAISEYAPGRLVVINKKTYKSSCY